MNQFSFSSEEDRYESHCLQQEIGFEQIGDWRGNSQQKAQFDGDDVETILNEFDTNLDESIERVEHNFTKHSEIGDAIDAIPSQDRLDQQEEQEKQPAATLESEHQKDQPVTFYEESNDNTTVVRQTVLQERWEGGRTALTEFLYVCETTYKPLLTGYKETLEKIKAYNQKSIGTLDMYCLFFRIKCEQETKRLKKVISLEKESEEITKNKLLELVYLDERTVASEIKRKSQQRQEYLNSFCEQLQESITKLKLLFTKALENRKKKIQDFEIQLDRIQRIKQQLINLLNQPTRAESQGWFGRADFRCDRYLQKKYLKERENVFLSLMSGLREKLVPLLNEIFVKQDPIILAVLNRQMIRYKILSEKLYGIYQAKESPNLNKISTTQINIQLAQILSGSVPKQWLEERTDQSCQCESIIQQVNNFLQNQIYLPVVQVDPDHILFTTQALWLSKNSSSQALENQKQNDKLVANTKRQEQGTCQALVTNRHLDQGATGMKVNIVLTIDKFLHFECGQQIATLKLKRLKLSSRGKIVFVSQKRRSLATFFASALALGQLQFETEEAALQFTKGVLNVHTQ